MKSSSNDAGIPLLTEIIGDASQAPVAAPAADSKAASAMLPPKMATPTGASGLAVDDAQWSKLEHDIRERVLIQVLQRIDFMLEHRIRDSLADALQTSIDSLTTDIRNGLQNTIKDVVTHAVTQEISKLQSSKK
jgi:hypothetical protein